jgi:hypothetical protein
MIFVCAASAPPRVQIQARSRYFPPSLITRPRALDGSSLAGRSRYGAFYSPPFTSMIAPFT